MTEIGTEFLNGLGEDLGNMLSTDEVGEAGAKLVETASTASVPETQMEVRPNRPWPKYPCYRPP